MSLSVTKPYAFVLNQKGNIKEGFFKGCRPDELSITRVAENIRKFAKLDYDTDHSINHSIAHWTPERLAEMEQEYTSAMNLLLDMGQACYSIGYVRDDGDFRVLATLSNWDNELTYTQFTALLGRTTKDFKHTYRHLKVEIQALERQDAPDYVEL